MPTNFKQCGPLEMGTARSNDFAFFGFRTGLDVKNPPDQIADTSLTIAVDGYLTLAGGFQQRNGMLIYNTHTTASSSLVLARFYQDVRNGAAIQPETVKLLGQIGNNLYTIPSGSAAFTLVGSIGVLGTPNPMTTVQIQNPNDPFFPSGLTDCMVICTGSGGPYIYDGTHLYTPPGWASATGAQWCAVVNGILWFGGVPSFPNQLFGAGDGITASMETLPGYRNFVLTYPVTGLSSIGTGANASLVIGMNIGISVLYGTGPNTFYRQDIPFQDGVTAGRTMATDNGIVYFLGHSAVFAFDGISVPKRISNLIEPWILNDPLHNTANDFPMTNRQYAWGQIYNNKYHLGYGNGSTTPNAILVYDLVQGAWTGPLRPPNGIMSMILLNAPSDPNPYQSLVGTSTTAQALQWDYVNASSAPAYDNAPTNTLPVLGMVQSKYYRLGQPGSTTCLTRTYPEIFIAGAFVAELTVGVDCGNAVNQQLLSSFNFNPNTSVGVWDTDAWDQCLWGGSAGFLRFGPQDTRQDWQLQGESFAFGLNPTSGLAPWIFSGISGTYQQQGRT